MHAIQPRTHHAVRHPDVVGPFPWEEAHAAPEDQAVGLELELIELVARRSAIVDPDSREARALDDEIDQTLTRLGSLEPLTIAG
jgi:hypothetical protein